MLPSHLVAKDQLLLQFNLFFFPLAWLGLHVIHLEMLFLAASLLFKRRREIEMGGGAEKFFNSVLWVGKEENICSKKNLPENSFFLYKIRRLVQM